MARTTNRGPNAALASDLCGADFIATERLSDIHDTTLAEAGERCDRVAVTSLPDLLRQGAIVPASAPAPSPENGA
jgi:hypothetical protein